VLAFSSSYAQMSQDQVGEMATAYFKAHPEKMMDILKGLQQHAQKQQEMQAKQNIVNSKSFFLGKDSFLPVMGNHNADKTLVFIYDFQCIYCHKEWPLIAKLMKENKDFKVVFMPLHVFGPASKLAAQAALYANLDISSERPKMRCVLVFARGS
jgi:protein-disulfide isomerase